MLVVCCFFALGFRDPDKRANYGSDLFTMLTIIHDMGLFRLPCSVLAGNHRQEGRVEVMTLFHQRQSPQHRFTLLSNKFEFMITYSVSSRVCCT